MCGLFVTIYIALLFALHFHGQGGIKSLHDNFHNLYLISLSKSSIVKKIAEFGFVVHGVASSFKFLAIIQRLQEASVLPIGNIIIFPIKKEF